MASKPTYDELEQRNKTLEEEFVKLKRVEKKLVQEKKRMETILSASETGLSLINPDMTIAWVNQKIREMFPDGEPVGQLCHVFFESRATICDNCQTQKAFMTGKVCENEQLVPATNKWYDIIAQPIKDSSGNVVNVLEGITDITRRKHAEEKVKKSQELLENIIDNIPEVFWVGSVDWQEIFYVSPAYEEIWGLPCSELYKNPLTWVESIHDEDREKVLEAIPDKIAGDTQAIKFPEFRIIQPNGEVRWIDARAFPIKKGNKIYRIAGIAEDITKRKKVEESFQSLVQSTVGRTGQEFFDNVCNQLCKIFHSEYAVIGELTDSSTVNAIAMVLDGKRIINYSYQLPGTPCENVATSGFCHYPEDINLFFPDDKELQDMAVTGYIGTPLKDHNGNTIGVLCVLSKNKMALPAGAKDLMSIIAARTSAEIGRMKEEREKEKLESQLLQAHKIEAIGTMAGGIAHDFNNVLAAIIGYSEIAKLNIPQSSPAQDDIEQVLKASNRAKDLVSHILSFSRMTDQRYHHENINLTFIVKEVLKFQRSIIPTTIEIKSDIDENCGQISGDPTQVHQVIMNLCTNALHAMEENIGTLKVSLYKTELSSEDLKTEPQLLPGTYLQVSVRDTGIGLTPELIDKIFDPYFTTKEVGKGSGMGLAVVQGIVKNHGGFVKVESQVGEGSTFHIFFPPIEKEIISEDSGETEHLLTGTERILFVDDEEMLVGAGKRMLEMLGYSVTTKTDSNEALELFKNDPSQFDLVITDQTMPNLPGSELAKHLLQIRSDIPIILCTGYSSMVDEMKAHKIGIREYTMKPLNRTMISGLIRKVLDGDESAS